MMSLAFASGFSCWIPTCFIDTGLRGLEYLHNHTITNFYFKVEILMSHTSIPMGKVNKTHIHLCSDTIEPPPTYSFTQRRNSPITSNTAT